MEFILVRLYLLNSVHDNWCKSNVPLEATFFGHLEASLSIIALVWVSEKVALTSVLKFRI